MPDETILVVDSAQTLADAYAFLSANGGGIIELSAAAEGIPIQLSNGGSDPVTIRSADPDDPVMVSRINLSNLENLNIQNVDVSSAQVDPETTISDLNISRSHHVMLDNVNFTGSATDIWSSENPDASFGTIRSSSDITISDSSISRYFQGVFLFESSGITIERTEISHMQGDGIRMEGVQDIRIADNQFHSFLGSPYSNNHDDMIQMWSVNTDIISRDIEIIGNLFDSSGGVGTQTILIQSEAHQGNPDLWYENITISDNVIYNSHTHGIRVSSVHGVDVHNNTVLWNPDSGVIRTGADDTSTSAPRIQVYYATDVSVTNNISGGYALDDSAYTEGNRTVDYFDPSSPNYLEHHFVNATSSGLLDLTDLALRPDSDWVGSGAELSQPGVALGEDEAVMRAETGNDIWEMTFDASGSDFNGVVQYVWTFEDGTTLEGEQVSRGFDTQGEQTVVLDVYRDGELIDTVERDFTIENRDFFEFDFLSGLDELADTNMGYTELNPDHLSANGYHIGGSDYIRFSRSGQEQHNLEQFGFHIDLDLETGNEFGTFLYLHGALSGAINSDGQVVFTLFTDEGRFDLASDMGTVSAAGTQSISVLYDGRQNILELHVNGEIVDSMEASGFTAPMSFHGMAIGHPWGGSIDADVQSVYFGHDLDRADEYAHDPDTQNPPTENDMKSWDLTVPLVLPAHYETDTDVEGANGSAVDSGEKFEALVSEPSVLFDLARDAIDGSPLTAIEEPTEREQTLSAYEPLLLDPSAAQALYFVDEGDISSVFEAVVGGGSSDISSGDDRADNQVPNLVGTEVLLEDNFDDIDEEIVLDRGNVGAAWGWENPFEDNQNAANGNLTEVRPGTNIKRTLEEPKHDPLEENTGETTAGEESAQTIIDLVTFIWNDLAGMETSDDTNPSADIPLLGVFGSLGESAGFIPALEVVDIPVSDVPLGPLWDNFGTGSDDANAVFDEQNLLLAIL